VNKNLRPSIFEKLDEIVAAGRTMPAACSELRSMIRDRAVILLDLHDPPQIDEWLRQAAATLIDAVRQNSRTTPLDDREPLPSSRDTSEEACRKLIVSLDDSGLRKAVIFDRARKQIPDLQLVEFKRAWHNGANLLKKRGRRTSSN
jgi:hypothetical protein